MVQPEVLRGGLTAATLAAAAYLGLGDQLAETGVGARIALLLLVVFPLVMSSQLASRDERYAADYWFGLLWFLPAVAFLGWRGQWTGDGTGALMLLPLPVGLFGFGVLYRHTSVAEQLNGGVAGAYRKMVHPKKRLLGGLSLCMCLVPVLGFVRIAMTQGL